MNPPRDRKDLEQRRQAKQIAALERDGWTCAGLDACPPERVTLERGCIGCVRLVRISDCRALMGVRQ